jgi:hypothetical protein
MPRRLFAGAAPPLHQIGKAGRPQEFRGRTSSRRFLSMRFDHEIASSIRDSRLGSGGVCHGRSRELVEFRRRGRLRRRLLQFRQPNLRWLGQQSLGRSGLKLRCPSLCNGRLCDDGRRHDAPSISCPRRHLHTQPDLFQWNIESRVSYLRRRLRTCSALCDGYGILHAKVLLQPEVLQHAILRRLGWWLLRLRQRCRHSLTGRVQPRNGKPTSVDDAARVVKHYDASRVVHRVVVCRAGNLPASLLLGEHLEVAAAAAIVEPGPLTFSHVRLL